MMLFSLVFMQKHLCFCISQCTNTQMSNPPYIHTTDRSLTHRGWVAHLCVNRLTIIGSDNGLSSDRRRAIIWTNVVILLIGFLETNFSEILIEIHFLYRIMHLKMSSGKWWPFCLGLNMLIETSTHSPKYYFAYRYASHYVIHSHGQLNDNVIITFFASTIMWTALVIIWLYDLFFSWITMLHTSLRVHSHNM